VWCGGSASNSFFVKTSSNQWYSLGTNLVYGLSSLFQLPVITSSIEMLDLGGRNEQRDKDNGLLFKL
jgi:hypothetical protein